MNSKRGFYFAGLVFLVLLISLVSAGFFDLLNPSGRASSGTQDVQVNVVGTNPPVVEQPSSSIAAQNPNEATTKDITFAVWITDDDGVANINDSSLLVRVSRGATIRTATCINPTNIDSNTRGYSCTVTLQYYDEAGTWDLYVEAKDQEANTGSTTLNSFFTYNELKAFQVPLSPSTLSWPALNPGATDVSSANDPTVVTNTGNYAGNIFVAAYDLQGETTSTEIIGANAFSVGSTTAGAECNVGTTAIALGPNDGDNVNTGISANPGPVGTASIYYCITQVPLVSSQAYSTSTRLPAVSWIVSY